MRHYGLTLRGPKAIAAAIFMHGGGEGAGGSKRVLFPLDISEQRRKTGVTCMCACFGLCHMRAVSCHPILTTHVLCHYRGVAASKVHVLPPTDTSGRLLTQAELMAGSNTLPRCTFILKQAMCERVTVTTVLSIHVPHRQQEVGV